MKRANHTPATFLQFTAFHTASMYKTAVLEHSCENPLASTNQLSVGVAQNLEDLIDCQRLRYLVFNCELGEGLEGSSRDGLDRDRFDYIFDHLLVRDATTGKLVGTYRMQSGFRAKGNLGYYSEQFFDFTPFESIRAEVLELGRACVHTEYRNTAVLHMLWKGIARYATSCGARYLLGCSSLSSQDENEGIALYESLKEKYLIEPTLRTEPRPEVLCRHSETAAIPPPPKMPRLFRAYLDVSARLCGPPAIDRAFKTIDFLTLIDLQHIPDRVRTRLF
ncbi:MAG TPA: GNAT family N-acyltransferase [Candidatus Acidoferrum sp.]|nr:GNAT family N-acyltransferase [Candidatus Acidoferrum sp.]